MQLMPAVATYANCSLEDILLHYATHLGVDPFGDSRLINIARSHLTLHPDLDAFSDLPLSLRLTELPEAKPFLLFLMLHGYLRPGYDYLVERKLCGFWHELKLSPMKSDIESFLLGAQEAGFSKKVSMRVASQTIARLLIQSGKSLEELESSDLSDLANACIERKDATGHGWRHYKSALAGAERVLFHLEVLESPPKPWLVPKSFLVRMSDSHPVLQSSLIAYLERKMATCRPKTVSSLATRLSHFGRFISECDPELTSIRDLKRQRHIEPYLNSVATAINPQTDKPITTADQARRIIALACFFRDITEWGWDDIPSRILIFRSDIPRLPAPLPRYIPIDADRRLAQALQNSNYRLAADALLLARATGLRIGELLDLELDCIHEIPSNGSWLKVPLGKLDTERMVPLEDDTVSIIDRIVATRSCGRALTHPRTGKPAQFLFMHHGRRISQNALREELSRAALAAGIGHVTPHQLRHTFATSMVNSGVSLQVLMALLGHVSSEMSLRYGRLFDTTIRTEYERALDLVKTRIGPVPKEREYIPVIVDDPCSWQSAPLIKSRLSGGHCLRAIAQGPCPYANICEHCANFSVDATNIEVLDSQRRDTQTLAEDASNRGWITEADRHRSLVTRLDALIAQAGLK